MKTLFWMMALSLVILFAIHFSLQNTKELTLQYSLLNYHWEIIPLPLFLIIFISIFLGVMIGGLGDLYKRFQLKRAIRKSQKTIEKLEKEIQGLRGLGSNPPSFLKREE